MYLLGVSLSGDVPALAAALKKLKAKNVKVMWISAFGMPDEFHEELAGLLIERVYDGTLLEAVGQTFKEDVEALMPYVRDLKRVSSEGDD